MRCNIEDCYWSMWSPRADAPSGEPPLQCISERLDEHFDEDSDFKMTPNSKECQGYLSYKDFVGMDKQIKK